MKINSSKLIFALSLILAAVEGRAVTNEVYVTNRSFTSIGYNSTVRATVYRVHSDCSRLSSIVKATNGIVTNLDATFGIEKRAISIGYLTPEDAWNAVKDYDAIPVTSAGISDQAGWIRGTRTTVTGEWGAYIWTHQNQIAFTSSPSITYRACSNGPTVEISNVFVGSLGEYKPMEYRVETGPSLDPTTNYPGANTGEDRYFHADYTSVYYRLTIPNLLVKPCAELRWVGGSNVNYIVSGTNIPLGVDWTITTNGITNGAAVLTGTTNSATVTVGTVATNYTIRAISIANTGIYSEASLAVVGIEKMMYTIIGQTVLTNMPIPPDMVAMSTGQWLWVQAIKVPSDAPWPAGRPVWTGVTDQAYPAGLAYFLPTATGIYTTKVECGNTVTGLVLVIKLDIEINNTTNQANHIVCRYSTSPAERPKIPCRARLQCQTATNLTIVLANKPGGGEVRFSEESDTEKTLVLSSDGTWVDFEISGQTQSSLKDDAVIQAHLNTAEGQVLGEENLTVLWGEMTGRNSGPIRISPVYEDHGYVLYATGLSDLGVQMHSYTGNFARGCVDIRCRISPTNFYVGVPPVGVSAVQSTGTEGLGAIMSNDWGFIINRELNAARKYYNATNELVALSVGPGGHLEDDSWPECQDQTPDIDANDANNLVIVDVDSPGTETLSGGTDTRSRYDFTQWITFTYQVNGVKQVIRCSDDYLWSVRMRIIDGGGGVPVLWTNDVNTNGIPDPGDDFPNDGVGENEILLNAHNPNLDP